MPQLNTASLRDTVQKTIDEGRLGRPQFMRCFARAGAPENLASSLGELESLGEAWFGSPHAQSYRLGEDSTLYQTEMLKWSDGQGAILTATASADSPQIDLLLVGSRGTLYHES